MSSDSIVDRPRLSLAEAAQTLGVHVNTLHRWNLRGLRGQTLRVIRIGGRTFVLKDDLEAFITALSDPPSSTEQAVDFSKRASEANARCESLGL